MITGLRRSCLYVPCDREKMLRKAPALEADLLLLNLEDGVAASHKEAARSACGRALRELDFGPREVVVRINPLSTPLGRADLEAVAAAGPDGICLPKVEGPQDVVYAANLLGEMEQRLGLPPNRVRLHAMIESARGVLQAAVIAAALPRLEALHFGSADFTTDLRCMPAPDRAELQVALQLLVLAARAAGIDVIDAPCFDLQDDELLRREATQARRLGFDGKGALRPAQLPALNAIFDVTEEEISWARQVLPELAAAEHGGRSLSTLDGRLIDDPHRRAAERILLRAQKKKAP